MAAASHALQTHRVTKSPISIPWVIAAALLCGIGIMGLMYWLVTSQGIYFAAVIPCIAGALMFLDPRAGANHA
jgi:hypothetical protein